MKKMQKRLLIAIPTLLLAVLAVVLATPCTAPFLGTAVGLAFAGSAGTGGTLSGVARCVIVR